VAGLGLLVGADQLTNKDWEALDKGKGDGFMILGATLYGFSASLEASTLTLIGWGLTGVLLCSKRN